MMETKNMPKLRLEDYITSVLFALQGQEENIQQAIFEVRRIKEKSQRMWVVGNGGSLAIAQHFAQDMLKMYAIRSQCLNDASVITAYTNDNGFQSTFFNPLQILMEQGDLLFAFSCSGKSPNYEWLFPTARNRKIKTIAVVGTDGGFMKERANISVHVNSKDYRVCEAGFGIVADLINIGLED